MEREEQMLQAAADTLKVFRSSFVKSIERIWVTAFTTGAYWADRHQQNVWHDASEMPNNHSYLMLMIDRYTIKTDYVPACLKHCQLNRSNWNEFVKDANIRQWAYINDLLPKTEEL